MSLFQAIESQSIDLIGVNLAYVTLLPKRETPKEIKDYSRCHCNTQYPN
jgi:hypothetical protein